MEKLLYRECIFLMCFQITVTRSWCLRTSSYANLRLIVLRTLLFYVNFQSSKLTIPSFRRGSCGVTSIRHWIVLFCERYWLAGVGGAAEHEARSRAGKIFTTVVNSPSKSVSCQWGSPPAVFLIFVCSYLLESKLRIRDKELQAAASDRNSLLAGPQGHGFFITKTSSKRLCIRCFWRNVVCRRGG